MIKEELKLLCARVDDAIRLSERGGTPKFVGFLDEMSAAAAFDYAKNRAENILLYGGYDDSERVFFGAFPDWCVDNREEYFPVCAVTFTFRPGTALTHRDFLGCLMGLKLKRESVGDILIEDGRAVAFMTKEAAALALNEIDKVGSSGVKTAEGYQEPLPATYTLTEHSDTIPSPRLDAVVASLSNTSRGNAAELIETGLVIVNAFVCEKTTKQISAGDIIKIRGKGKFIVDSVSEHTKKQRIILKYRKYC